MDGVLCYIAVQDGRVKRSSLEVLTRLRELTAVTGSTLGALIVDEDPDRYVADVAEFGAGKIYTVKHAAFSRHVNELHVDAITDAVESSGASTLVMASTEAAKDMLGALSIRLSASVLPDVATLDSVDGGWEVLRPVMAAKRLARTRAATSPTVISVRSGAYGAVESPIDPEVFELSYARDDETLRLDLREVVTAATGQVDLSEARVVVAAGRGVKDEEGRRLVEELASLLGGAIGATRAVVENGLFAATAQIGQTGKVVSPELYFALGISGAIQHVAGMSNSRVIVAVNKDQEAPIFSYATYGIVGDLYRVVPLLITELRKAIGT
jgi:electron transfer flavoprotein alpha subunit